MLAMVLVVVPGGLGLVVWWSYRTGRLRSAQGRAFHPSGKIRWPEDAGP